MPEPAARASAAKPAPRAATGSLFGEMLDWMLAPFLLVWPLSIGVTYVIGISIAGDAFDRSLAAKTRALAEQVVWTRGKDGVELRADLRVLLADDDADTHFYRIETINGVFLLGEPELPSFTPEQLLGEGLVSFQTIDFRDSSIRIAALQREVQAPPAPPTMVVYVAEGTEKRKALAREIMKGIVFPQLLVVPLMILLMWMGLRRGAAPLERLRERVVARDAHDLRALDAPDAPEEVAPLINAFNDLLQRVENEGAAQKRFIANAAHQLRTPLAGIGMQTELALRSADPTERTEALRNIAQGTARTAHLINQLLMLARTEGAAGAALPFAPLDLTQVVRAVVAEAYPLASARKIGMAFDAPETAVMVVGHADLLRELVSNLVDNAIRYSAADGHVTVRVSGTASNEWPQLEVEDDGPGIPKAEREQVFERFYRAVGSAESGSGIGLAIVREIAVRHNAGVTIETPASSKGSLFRVRFGPAPAG